MKTNTILSLLTVLIITVLPSWIKPAMVLPRYEIKSAIIVYSITGMTTDTETLYFDDYGAKAADYKSNQVKITTNDWIISWNPKTKKGTRIKNPAPQMIEANKNNPSNIAKQANDMMKSMGCADKGSEEVAGKTCEKWECTSPKTSVWVWKGITLKSMVDLGGNMINNQVATSVQENADIPKDKFTVPSDIVIKDYPGTQPAASGR